MASDLEVREMWREGGRKKDPPPDPDPDAEEEVVEGRGW